MRKEPQFILSGNDASIKLEEPVVNPSHYLKNIS